MRCLLPGLPTRPGVIATSQRLTRSAVARVSPAACLGPFHVKQKLVSIYHRGPDLFLSVTMMFSRLLRDRNVCFGLSGLNRPSWVASKVWNTSVECLVRRWPGSDVGLELHSSDVSRETIRATAIPVRPIGGFVIDILDRWFLKLTCSTYGVHASRETVVDAISPPNGAIFFYRTLFSNRPRDQLVIGGVPCVLVRRSVRRSIVIATWRQQPDDRRLCFTWNVSIRNACCLRRWSLALIPT